MKQKVLLNKSQLGGTVFSLSAILPMILSFIMLVTIQFIAVAKSNTTGESAGSILEKLGKENWYVYLSYLVSQIAFFILALIAVKMFSYNLKDSIITKFNLKYILVSVLLSFGILFGLSWVNGYFVNFLEFLGMTPPSPSLPNMDSGFDFFLSILIIAVLPAIFEETLFRGVILDGLKSSGVIASALLCGVLFSIFHQNPTQTIYQFFNGAIFALLAIKAGSVIPVIVMHFINNAYILTMLKFAPNFAFSKTVNLIISLAGLIVLILTILYLLFLDKNNKLKKEKSPKEFIKYALIGIVFSCVMWVITLFS